MGKRTLCKKEVAEAIQSFFPSTSVESLEKSVQSYKNIIKILD